MKTTVLQIENFNLNLKIMKRISSIFLLVVGVIIINSCSADINNRPSGTFTVNLVDGSTNQPIPNIQGASWGPRFRHDIALETYNDGSNVQLNGGKLKINMAESHGKIRAIELSGPLSSEMDPTNAFSQKYYTQGDLSFYLSYGLERTQVYYTKAKIKCIVNVTKPENVGKKIYIELIEPYNQKVSINKLPFSGGYTINALTLGSQYVYIDVIGNYTNEIKWILNETLPFTNITIYCKESEAKDLIINL